MECPWPDRGGCESFNPHGAGAIVYPITGRGTGTETCGDRQCAPADLWIGLDIYTNYTLIYDLLLEVLLMGCATFINLYSR